MAAQDHRRLQDMPLLDPAILSCPYHYDKTLREQAPIAWEVLFERCAAFELACEPEALQYLPNILLRGLLEIPIYCRAA